MSMPWWTSRHACRAWSPRTPSFAGRSYFHTQHFSEVLHLSCPIPLLSLAVPHVDVSFLLRAQFRSWSAFCNGHRPQLWCPRTCLPQAQPQIRWSPCPHACIVVFQFLTCQIRRLTELLQDREARLKLTEETLGFSSALFVVLMELELWCKVARELSAQARSS